MEHTKQQPLSTPIASAEHDVTGDSPRDIDVDLHVVRRRDALEFMVCLDQLPLCGTVAVLFGTGLEERVPCG